MIFDSSALIAFILDQHDTKLIRRHLAEARMSSINLAEVFTVLTRNRRYMLEDCQAMIEKLMIDIIPFNAEQAALVGSLRHLEGRLSLGDRSCLAVGMDIGEPVLTTEKEWASIDIGVKIIMARL